MIFTSDFVKTIVELPHSWQKLVIHVNPYIILYFTNLLQLIDLKCTNNGLNLNKMPLRSCLLISSYNASPEERFKKAYDLLNLRALKFFSPVNKMHIFQCMG